MTNDFTLQETFFGRKFLLIALSIMFYASGMQAQDCDPMSCNDKLQLSVDSDCQFDFTADLFLEGDEDAQSNGDPFTITIPALDIFDEPLPLMDFDINVFEMGVKFTISSSCNSCWGELDIEDNIPPMLVDDPAMCLEDSGDCTITCLEEDWILNDTTYTGTLGWNPTFEDNCGDLDGLKYVDVLSGDDVCDGKLITRYWIYMGRAHGNTLNDTLLTQEFELLPLDPSTVMCPTAKVVVHCESGSHPDSIAKFFDDPITTTVNEGIDDAFPHLLGSDGEPFAVSNMTCNVMANYSDQPIAYCNGPGSRVKSLLRTWTILDWCTSGGAIRECTQIIDIVDTLGPIIDCVPDFTASTDPWFCGANVDVPAPEHLYGNCDGNVCYTVSILELPAHPIVGSCANGYSIVGLEKGIYTLVYTATDECGASNTCETTLTVLDATPPIAVAKENIVITLTSGPTNGNGVAKLFANSVDNFSYDACGPVHLQIRRHVDSCDIDGNATYDTDLVEVEDGPDADTDPDIVNIDTDAGAFVKFCCADLTQMSASGVAYGEFKVWLRVWDDGDMDGIFGSAGDNYNEVWAFVRVEDKLGTAIQCPPDITIDCFDYEDDLSLTGKAQASSNCGEKNVGYSDAGPLTDCGLGIIYRTWFVDMDNDGVADPNSATCIQEITVTPSNPFDGEIVWPASDTITCKFAADNDVPTWDDEDVCALLGHSLESDTFQFEDGACFKILNHWTVIDWCQYQPNLPITDPAFGLGIWRHTQVIKVIDNDAPDFLQCPEKIMVELDADCYATDVVVGIVAEDNGDCPSPWLKWEVCLDIDYDWTCDYVYSTNNPSSSPFYIAPTSSGEEVEVRLLDEKGDAIHLENGNHRIDFRVSDGCGNYRSCRTTLMAADKKAPTPYCISNISTTVMDQSGSITLWANDFDLGSFDNCTPYDELLFSFLGSELDANVTISCLGGGGDYELLDGVSRMIDLDIWVFDNGYDANCDGTITFDERNKDFCSVQLLVQDNVGVCEDQNQGRAIISGGVENEYGDKIPEAVVEVRTSMPDYPVVDNTAANGSYAFSNNPMSMNYTVSAEKEDDYLNGVSTLDLVLIQKHILGTEYLGSAYKVIAADVTNDQRVSSIDMVELRKLILGITTELADNDSWRFINANQDFNSTLSPWPFTEDISISNLNHNMMDQNFIGIKIGDVSGNAKANNANGIENRSNGKTNFIIDEQVVAEGRLVEVPFYTTLDKVIGYQFTMDFAGLELVEVKSNESNIEATDYRMMNNALTFSHAANEPADIDEPLFTLVFVATADGDLSRMIDLNSFITNAEIYTDTDLETIDLGLEVRGVEIDNFELKQNQPNPFSKETIISFMIPEAQQGTLSILDVTGKVIKEYTEKYQKGMNEITLNRAELGATGVMYYRLTVGDNSATRKMIAVQ